MLFNVLIVGVGLIGGSLGLALRDSPVVNKVIGVDTDRKSLKKARDIGAIDYAASLEEGVKQAEVIFLCTSTGCYSSIVEKIKPWLKPGTIITDVGSTKQEVMNIFNSLPVDVWTIGGHPMAGSETKGINGADRYLFENAVYILTPEKNTPDYIVKSLMKLLETTGARVKIMEAAFHDKLVAAVSHVPHLAAVALVGITEGESEKLMMAAGGFRDTTRIASSNPELWVDILFSNCTFLLEELENFINRLHSIKQALETNNRNELCRELSNAKKIRDQIPRMHKGLLPGSYDIVCIVPDRPGIIAQLGSILGEEGINIVDIEILRVREGDGGTIRLGVPSMEEACRAVSALQSRLIKSWIR